MKVDGVGAGKVVGRMKDDGVPCPMKDDGVVDGRVKDDDGLAGRMKGDGVIVGKVVGRMKDDGVPCPMKDDGVVDGRVKDDDGITGRMEVGSAINEEVHWSTDDGRQLLKNIIKTLKVHYSQ